jgi:hypothetical protein
MPGRSLRSPAPASRSCPTRADQQRHRRDRLPPAHRCQPGAAHRQLQQDPDVHAVHHDAVNRDAGRGPATRPSWAGAPGRVAVWACHDARPAWPPGPATPHGPRGRPGLPRRTARVAGVVPEGCYAPFRDHSRDRLGAERQLASVRRAHHRRSSPGFRGSTSSRKGSRPALRSASTHAVCACRRRWSSPSGLISMCSLSAARCCRQNGHRYVAGLRFAAGRTVHHRGGSFSGCAGRR